MATNPLVEMVQRANQRKKEPVSEPSAESVGVQPEAVQPAPTPATTVPTPIVGLSDYEALLLQVHRNKKGKGIQLDAQSHRTLSYIVRVVGGIALSDLLQNIVRLHFQQYSPHIQKMLLEKERLNKKERLLFQPA